MLWKRFILALCASVLVATAYAPGWALAQTLAQRSGPATDSPVPQDQLTSTTDSSRATSQADVAVLSPQGLRHGNKQLLLWLTELNATHPRILAANAEAKASGHRHGAARSKLFPSVDAKIDFGNENITRPAHESSMLRQVASISARQLVYDFGAVPGTIDKAAAEKDAKLTQLAQTRQDILYQGLTAYLNLLKTCENVRHAKLSVESIRRLSGIEDAMVERGMALSYDALQMKAQMVGARANLLRAEHNHVVALNFFAAVFGFRPSADELQRMTYPVPDKAVIPASLDAAVATALQTHPQLLIMKQTREANLAELKANEAAFFPRFDVVLEGRNRQNDQGVAGLRSEARASLQFGWNLFSGFQDTERVNATKANIQRMLRAELDTRRQVEEQSRNAWAQVVSARQNLLINQNQSALLKVFLGKLDEGRMSGATIRPITIIIGERDYLSSLDQAVIARTEAEIGIYTMLLNMGTLTLDVFAN